MNKRGPKPKYNFEQVAIGADLYIEPMLLASFKTTLSIFNKDREPKQVYHYQPGAMIKATRVV